MSPKSLLPGARSASVHTLQLHFVQPQSSAGSDQDTKQEWVYGMAWRGVAWCARHACVHKNTSSPSYMMIDAAIQPPTSKGKTK